jgi:glycosyltransferase involved in cell wall biosynthesis
LRAQAVFRVCRELKKSGVHPDVVVAHVGWGDTLFLKEVFPNAHLSGYFEYFYRSRGADLGFDPEFPASLDNRLEVRMKNSTQLLAWEDCDTAWTATRWVASLFPEGMRRTLKIQHEGVDTSRVQPDPQARFALPDGRTVRAGDEIVTFVNRSMEPYRGFHIFMRALPEILRRRPNAIVLVEGSENETGYGNRRPGGETWKQWMMREVGAGIDLKRVYFLGRVLFAEHVKLLQVSRVHVYLSYPYIASWSLLEAMACGCVVIGSKTPPVTEFVDEGENGVLVDFFDFPALAERVVEALAQPDRFAGTRQRARQKMVELYDLDRVCLPALVRLVSGG